MRKRPAKKPPAVPSAGQGVSNKTPAPGKPAHGEKAGGASAGANPVANFITGKQTLLTHFQCAEDYFVKPLLDCRWGVTKEDGFYILAYESPGLPQETSVIVKRDGEPLIYKAIDYTMVVAIDCVKIAFILKNSNREGA